MSRKKNTDDGFPYFKFVISKYSTGNIQQCSLSAQGLFINLCVLYWGQRGELLLSKMHKRFQRKQKQFDELLNENVIKLNSDQIEITFLDEQLAELGLVSEKNRKNAQKRWNQNKSDATASNSQSETDTFAMPIEESKSKKREEERREEDAQISPGGFSDEAQNPVSREAQESISDHCKFFSVTTDVMSPRYEAVVDFIEMLFQRGEFPALTISFEKYKAYKARSQEQIHSVAKWMGTIEKYYRDGEWTMTDWNLKLNNLEKSYERQSTKGSARPTSAQVSGTNYNGFN